MKTRAIAALIGLLIISVYGFLSAAPERLPWIAMGLVCFGGILLFDIYNQVPSRWMNVFLFFTTYGLIIQSVMAVTPDVFWRDFAGAIFLISLLFEQNAPSWTGLGSFRTTVTPALIFFLLVLAQNIPFLTAEITYGFSFVAILIAAYLEFFSILRENTAMNTGSFMSALRMACTGIGCLFYSSVFLPGIARQAPFSFALLALPILAIGVSIFALLLKHWRRRQILFCCNWSLFIFWAALTGEDNRFYAAIGALVAGVWSVMMTDRNPVHPSNLRDLYLKLSAWGIPGSFLFTMLVFALGPTSNNLVRQGSALWLISFFVYWSGLRSFTFSSVRSSSQGPWNWRNRLALIVNLAGASLLAWANLLPTIFSDFWSGSGGMNK